MASAERRVQKLVGYPPLSEVGDLQRPEFNESLLDANAVEDVPGRWQPATIRGGSRIR
jgi:hypothetical protein